MKLPLIGLSGPAGSGKDTLTDLLVTRHDYAKIALADPMKRFCAEVFDFSEDQLWGPSANRNEDDKRYVRGRCREQDGTPYDVYLTPRHALQQLGTEWGRSCYGDVWIDYALRMVGKLEESPGSDYEGWRGFERRSFVRTVEGVVIPDVRFQNEFRKIRERGGKLVRIVRERGRAELAAHASETEQRLIGDEEFDLVVVNEGSIEELAGKVEKMLEIFALPAVPRRI